MGGGNGGDSDSSGGTGWGNIGHGDSGGYSGGHGGSMEGLTIFDLMRMVEIDSSKFPFTIFGSEDIGMRSCGVTTTNNTIKQIVTDAA